MGPLASAYFRALSCLFYIVSWAGVAFWANGSGIGFGSTFAITRLCEASVSVGHMTENRWENRQKSL